MADASQALQRNKRDAEVHLQILDPTETIWTFVAIKGKAVIDKRGTFEDLWGWIRARNDECFGIYVVPNHTPGLKRDDKSVDRIRVVFVDHDKPDDPERCVLYEKLKAKYPPHLEVETSEGKFQAYFRVDDVKVAEFAAIQDGLSDTYRTDTTVGIRLV